MAQELKIVLGHLWADETGAALGGGLTEVEGLRHKAPQIESPLEVGFENKECFWV